MKQIILLIVYVIIMQSSAFAYDFYSTSPSGHVLYYRIISGSNVNVTWQNSSSPRYSNLSGNVTIPATVYHGGITYNVIGIDNYTFDYCMYLTSINIPNTVTSIGIDAFRFCSSLSTITWNNSVQSIGNYAFYNCSALSVINIPNSVTSIGNYSFAHCSAATTINIGDSVTTIGESAFWDCTSATNLTIGNSVTNIGNGAFDGCVGISSVSIPASVNYIGAAAFYDCNSISYTSYEGTINNWLNIEFGGTYSNPVYYSRCLHIGDTVVRSVSIPNGVTTIKYNTFCGMDSLLNVSLPNSIISIDHYAFFNCTGLTKIEIPSSVNIIGYRAFHGCHSLDTIICNRNIPPNCISDSPNHNIDVFGGSPLLTTILVPCRTINIYATSPGWNYFSNYNPIYNTITYSISSSNRVMGTVSYSVIGSCGDSIIVTAFPNDGFHFVTWSDGSTENPHYCHFNSDHIELIGSFDTNIYSVTTSCNPTEGITFGDTIIKQQSVCYVTIQAESNPGYDFLQWSDGSTDSIRVLAVVSDTSLIAFFTDNTQHCLVIASTNNEYMGGVSGGGYYIVGDTVCLTATPFSGYAFLGWSNGVQDNPYCFVANQNVSLTAIFIDTINNIMVTVTPNDITMGGTIGSGNYCYGDTVVCIATPFTGYSFRGWSNGCQENPYSFVATENVELMAVFVENVGVEKYEGEEQISLYPNPAKTSVTVYSKNNILAPLIIVDNTGRVIKRENPSGEYTTIDISDLQSGIYFVNHSCLIQKLVICQ